MTPFPVWHYLKTTNVSKPWSKLLVDYVLPYATAAAILFNPVVILITNIESNKTELKTTQMWADLGRKLWKERKPGFWEVSVTPAQRKLATERLKDLLERAERSKTEVQW